MEKKKNTKEEELLEKDSPLAAVSERLADAAESIGEGFSRLLKKGKSSKKKKSAVRKKKSSAAPRRAAGSGERTSGTERPHRQTSASRTGEVSRTAAGSRTPGRSQTRRDVETRAPERSARPASVNGTPRKKSAAARKAERARREKQKKMIIGGISLVILLVLVIAVTQISSCVKRNNERKAQEAAAAAEQAAREEAERIAAEEKAAFEAWSKAPEGYVFQPTCTENTKPSNLITSQLIEVNGDVMEPSEYTSTVKYNFGEGPDYTNLEGIITFRGNNFRNAPSYGTAEMPQGKLTQAWTKDTGSLDSWTGSGWTGQPLIVKWPEDVKKNSCMYDKAKSKSDLVEVIYACMDGYVYFMDLETGESTRDPMYLGYTFKGAGALDPRGYPIMYLGAGINSSTYGSAHVFVINLLDNSVMYEFGADDPFALRYYSFFDSSALVSAENDMLIYPGENGLLYLIKLNTQYDKENGTVSINPDQVIKWRYDGNRSTSDYWWWGMEDSAVIYSHYLFIGDNGGYFMCLDLNTLELVWVQDILDDSNCTPVLEFEDGHPYIYMSTSFHLGWRSSSTAEIPIWKFDAENGEIVWKTSYDCHSIVGVSGGVQSTLASGKNKLRDYIYVTVSMIHDVGDGVCVALRKDNGEKAFEHSAAYAWSSPVCVYDQEGNGNVLYCSSAGKMYLLDGLTGEEKDMINLGDSTIEASPAVYNNMAVVGTRDCMIYGIQLG